MERWGRIRTARRLPCGLLGMLVLCAAVERRVSRNDLDFRSDMPVSWCYSRDQASRRARNAGVLCFGSSIVKFGVHAPTVERRTGLPTFNLAVFNGRVASSYYLFKHALDAGARPRAVVVDSIDRARRPGMPPPPADDPARNRRNWAEVLTPAEGVELARLGGGWGFLTRLVLDEALPSLRARHEVRDWVVGSLAGRLAGRRQDALTMLRNWNANQGSQVMPSAGPPAVAPPGTPRAADGGPAGALRATPLLDVYARKLLDLAAARGVTVFWLLPPVDPAVQATHLRDGHARFASSYAKRLMKDYPNLVVVDGRGAAYGAAEFVHLVHLNAAGSACFSDDLGRAIARHLRAPGGPRWVALPPFHPVAPDPAPEDMARSRLAVAAGGRGRF